jgi:hypothetical protein
MTVASLLQLKTGVCFCWDHAARLEVRNFPHLPFARRRGTLQQCRRDSGTIQLATFVFAAHFGMICHICKEYIMSRLNSGNAC